MNNKLKKIFLEKNIKENPKFKKVQNNLKKLIDKQDGLKSIKNNKDIKNDILGLVATLKTGDKESLENVKDLFPVVVDTLMKGIVGEKIDKKEVLRDLNLYLKKHPFKGDSEEEKD